MTRPGRPAQHLDAALSLYRRRGQLIESTVRGRSMMPTLPPGSRIRIRCQPHRVYHRGEVVAFLTSGHVVAHRVRWQVPGRQGGYLVTQGDALRVPDVPVAVPAVLGPVVGIWGEGGWRPVPEEQRRSRLGQLACVTAVGLLAGLLRLAPALGHAASRLLLRLDRLIPRREAQPDETA